MLDKLAVRRGQGNLTVRETEILIEQQPPQGFLVCAHAGLVINEFSLTEPDGGAGGDGDEGAGAERRGDWLVQHWMHLISLISI